MLWTAPTLRHRSGHRVVALKQTTMRGAVRGRSCAGSSGKSRHGGPAISGGKVVGLTGVKIGPCAELPV